MNEFCSGCGQLLTDAADVACDQRERAHDRCERRQQATDPPRYCTACGRKLVVQVLPIGWRARCVRCGELPSPAAR